MNIRKIYFILAAAMLAISFLGCGKANDKAPALNATAQHPTDWFTGHRKAYFDAYTLEKAAQCRDCHGTDLMGGIAKVGCSTTSCHAGGHPPRVVHSLPFKAATLHGPAALADIASCGACHATSTAPVSNPRFNIGIGSLINGCEDCHKTGTAHPPVDPAKLSGYPSSWNNHAAAGNIANSCTLCHGLDFNGGSGPSCRNCHNVSGAVMPPVAGQCLSCHAKPPATGGHAAHNVVASLTNLCTACHFGAANGTPRHGSRGFANVSTAISTGFNAKTGAAGVTASLTCQNVSCHGGVTTPPWATGSINVATQCAQCHTAGTASQTPQYNSFWSGEHAKHVTDMHLPCTDCHDMSVTSGSNSHFSNMATPAFELTPALTIRGPVNYSGGSCSPGNNPAQFSIGVCHGSKNW